jgi:hypothetical protein
MTNVDTYTSAAELERVLACGGAPEYVTGFTKVASNGGLNGGIKARVEKSMRDYKAPEGVDKVAAYDDEFDRRFNAEMAKATEVDVSKLSDIAFAYPKGRLWPVHCKKAAWLSLASYARQAAIEAHPEAEAVEGRLMSACDLHGITEAEKAAALEASFQAEDELRPPPAIPVEVAGRTFSIPLEGAGAELDKVALWLYENAAAIGFDGRHEGAKTLLKTAQLLGADIGGFRDLLEKSAGYEGDDESITRGLRGRMLRLRDFDGYRESIHEKFSGLSFVDACRLVEKIDKEAGLDRAYGKEDAGGIDLPEEVLTEEAPAEEPAEEPDTEIAPGIGSKKVKSKAADISAAMNLGAQDVDAVAEAVKGMSADQQQAVRSIVG